ncbi:MAG: hypothetical protein V1794_02550, partial [Candidatus Glassbacteria bacterium]
MRLFRFAVILFASTAILISCAQKPQPYPIRWVYISRNLGNDQQVEEIRGVLTTAAEHGLNGVYLSAGFDGIDLKGEDWFRRLAQVKSFCDSLGLDLVPRCLDVGYNGGLLAHDQNLAEGLPVRDALFVVKGREAVLEPDPPVALENGGFEKSGKDGVPGFEFAGEFGRHVLVDKEMVSEGKSALRFEGLSDGDNPGRLIKRVTVSPDRLYRLRMWVKTEGINESDPFGSGNFRVQVKGGNRQLTYIRPRVGQNSDWTEVTVGFNSRNYDQVEIQTGMWGAQTGRFWLDGLSLEEIGLVNLLRRPGTPLVIKGEKSGTVYEEGRDYEKVEDPQLNHRFNHDGPPIRLTADSRIKDGERLRVSYYHSVSVYASQVTACVSEPKVYDIWRTIAGKIKETIDPKYWFMSVDEVRACGTCQACRDRGLTLGEIISDCITRQAGIIREADPGAEVVVWSDMLDPNHNAGERTGNYYYHVDGSFTGSWNHVPKDLIIACWYHEKRRESLAHFSGLGMRTIACGYYDEDNTSNDS